jgi:prevent-host-death family protein
MVRVGVRELRQNLSKYLKEVKQGETFVVTERGVEVGRLSPSGPGDSPIARLVAERGATMPRRDLLMCPAGRTREATGGLTSAQILEEQREERL